MLEASIILATYCPNKQRLKFCEQAFAEIHRTGIPRDRYELIVIDNGGLQRDLIDQLDTDIVLTSSHNIGQAAALNAGIAIALSDNLVVAHDDMSYGERWLWKGLKLLKVNRKYVVGLNAHQKKYEKGKAGKNTVFVRKIGGVILFRRQLFNKVGRFGLVYHSHGGLWYRNLLRKKSKIVVGTGPPPVIHIGSGKSIIAYKPWLIRDYRNPRPS